MNNLALSLISAIAIGLGATLVTDLWALFVKRTFKIPAPNYCLVGRWLRTMPEGIFWHANIASAPKKSAECAAGWVAHYMIGVMFAIIFIAVMGNQWLQHPTLMPAIIFGIVTVSAPFFIMQPAFGFGFAASKTPNPTQARLRSLMTHAAFGVGLYLWTVLVNWLVQVYV